MLKELARTIGRWSVDAQTQVDFLKTKMSVLVLKLNPWGCGYTASGLRYHDHPVDASLRGVTHDASVATEWVEENWYVPYNAQSHGNLQRHGEGRVISEGTRVPNLPNSTDGEQPIHRHSATSSSGTYEYHYE